MLYTSIPHKLLKSLIVTLVHSSFKRRDGGTRYTQVKVGQRKGCFVHSISGGENLNTADQICGIVDSE